MMPDWESLEEEDDLGSDDTSTPEDEEYFARSDPAELGGFDDE